MKYRFTKKQKRMLCRILSAAAVFAAGIVLGRIDGLNVWISRSFFLLSYLIVGYDVLWDALRGIVRGQVFDENFLMAVASLGAIVISDYPEAAAVMLFYQVGELFQSVAVGKSRHSIASLTAIRPDVANLLTDGCAEKVDPEDVPAGSLIAVNPGERVPLDGVIVEGETSLDTSALTGESLPVEAKAGDAIVSGSINLTGAVTVRTTKEFGESTVSRILELVEDSVSRKSQPEAFITKFAKIYTPAVCALALALFAVPPVVIRLCGGGWEFSEWLRRALTFLVISCPCALVLSIPMTFFGGIGCASHNGILVKGSNYLETLARAGAVVFDKTGTLTEGRFAVTDVTVCGPMEEGDVLKYAAFAEAVSTHPVAAAIRAAYGAAPGKDDVRDIKEIAGRGVEATVLDRRVTVGRDSSPDRAKVGVTVAVTVDGETVGYITASDRVKDDSKAALDALRGLGVSDSYMLTGDRGDSARLVAEKTGVGSVRAELLPSDKVGELEKIIAGSSSPVIYAGDGINDAPSLARADVGVAMGALGSDAAIEAADVVIMDDDIKKVPLAVRIARKTMRIAKENIIFALGVKAVCLILGALGVAGMWIAIFADVGVMVLAVLNAARALRI
ncbi:MAG: cadmium-translocating P-type ATPase [Clostridia bacterium]|nr:cadmium-translocating P-type ATPase [Clostridia bacterium]